jgi:hypothetical protein
MRTDWDWTIFVAIGQAPPIRKDHGSRVALAIARILSVYHATRLDGRSDRLVVMPPSITGCIRTSGADRGKMILEGCGKGIDETQSDRTTGWPLLMLSIATSIDALAVGFSFSVLKHPILFPAVVIGVVCFVMTATGMIFGKALAKLFGRKVEIFGGIVLIVIGVKILFDHLM